jgi:hypothetical protein
MSGDAYIISGLRERRSAVVGQIVDLRRQVDKLQADLMHIDAVLKLYGLEPAEIPNKGRMPVRSAHFGRNELSRRCRDEVRDNLCRYYQWPAHRERQSNTETKIPSMASV